MTHCSMLYKRCIWKAPPQDLPQVEVQELVILDYLILGGRCLLWIWINFCAELKYLASVEAP